MSVTKTKTVATVYWILTAVLLLPLAGTGIPEALGHPSQSVAHTMRLLGYPSYLPCITGTAKVLGAIVIAIGRFPKLTEWAYAGYSCLLLGATASHLFVGDFAIAPYPFLGFVWLMASYVLLQVKMKTQRPVVA